LISYKTIRADVSQEMSYVYEKVKQYDNLSRKYRLMITNKGNMVQLKGNEAIRLRMWADGESTPYVDDWLKEAWEDGYPILIFSSEMLSKIGKVKFEFVIQEPGSPATISTRQQNLLIQKSLIDYDGLIASGDFDVLSHLIGQALIIPDLINDFNTSQEEINQLIIQIHNDMSNYQSQFAEMQTNVADLIQSTETYIQQLAVEVNNTLTQANTAVSTANQLIDTADNTLIHVTQKANDANNYANIAQRFAKGGIIPEDTEDNAEWYYRQTKNLKEQVDTASKLIIPLFYIDFETGELMSETEAKGMDFWIDDGDLYGEEVI
jgi:methyl-accepting chemotaxis protein